MLCWFGVRADADGVAERASATSTMSTKASISSVSRCSRRGERRQGARAADGVGNDRRWRHAAGRLPSASREEAGKLALASSPSPAAACVSRAFVSEEGRSRLRRWKRCSASRCRAGAPTSPLVHAALHGNRAAPARADQGVAGDRRAGLAAVEARLERAPAAGVRALRRPRRPLRRPPKFAAGQAALAMRVTSRACFTRSMRTRAHTTALASVEGGTSADAEGVGPNADVDAYCTQAVTTEALFKPAWRPCSSPASLR